MPLQISPLQRVALTMCVALVGCATTQPVPYAGLQSSAQLQPNSHDTGNTPFRLARSVEWSRYSKLMLDPVVVYVGTDQQFEDVSEPEKKELADYLRTQFSARLRSRFEMVGVPGPRTLQVRLTLTGAKTTTRGVSTLTRFDLAGGPYNAVQAARGKEGAFTGSVSYAVEIYDAATQEVLAAFVSKQYPNAWNLGATFSRLEAARVGIDKGAEELLGQLM
jgi:hypothetical protein